MEIKRQRRDTFTNVVMLLEEEKAVVEVGFSVRVISNKGDNGGNQHLHPPEGGATWEVCPPKVNGFAWLGSVGGSSG
jgi:hypothetical protein